jgi:hypothetical protein
LFSRDTPTSAKQVGEDSAFNLSLSKFAQAGLSEYYTIQAICLSHFWQQMVGKTIDYLFPTTYVERFLLNQQNTS